MNPKPLTFAQSRCFVWVDNYIAAKGRSPSYREIMTGLGYKSPAPVQSLLLHLRNKGFIDWQPSEVRTIVIKRSLVPSISFTDKTARLLIAERDRCEAAGLIFEAELAKKLAA